MSQGLFRKEVVDSHQNRLHGEILLLPHFSHTLILGVLLFWFFVVLTWLVFSNYARKETVFGWLEPPSGVVRVYAEDNGVIKKILVAEGEFVEKNQPLIIVNGDRLLANGDNMEDKLLEEYESQRQLLNKQAIRVQSINNLRAEEIAERIAAAQHELVVIEEQLKTIKERYQLVVKQVDSYRSLKEQGHVSALEYDNILSQELILRSDQQSLLRSKISQKNIINQLRLEQSQLPDDYANTQDQIRQKLSDIAQQVAQLSGQRSHVIKSTRRGIVNNLQAIEGQQANMGSNIPLLTLLPVDTLLTVHLLVPVRAAGFVEPGQRLDIRYDAFPYQKFGLYEGVIDSISKTLLLPNEIANLPVSLQEPVYRVVAQLKHPTVKAYGKDFPLKPGMTLSADVRLSERSLIQWLFEPVFSLQGRI
jgi:membrane fusion protein